MAIANRILCTFVVHFLEYARVQQDNLPPADLCSAVC